MYCMIVICMNECMYVLYDCNLYVCMYGWMDGCYVDMQCMYVCRHAFMYVCSLSMYSLRFVLSVC